MRNRLFTLLAILALAATVSAQEVVVRRDTVRDTIVIRETIREYVLDTSAVAHHADVKPEKKKQPIRIRFAVRADWESHFNAPELQRRTGAKPYESAFLGKYINFHLDGNITDHLSYHYTQRLNRINMNGAFFRSIDKASFDYDFNDQWRISAGKFAMAIGGWEYDAAPIDIYFASEFWNNINCFQFGIRGTYTTKDKRNSVILEVSNSPMNPYDDDKVFNGLFAYSLMWCPHYGIYHGCFSLNMIEYQKGSFFANVAFGNRFTAGPMNIELDYMERIASDYVPFRDLSAILKVEGNIRDWVKIHAKVGYEISSHDFMWVPTGENGQFGENFFYGVGIEAFPIRKFRDFRLHAFWTQGNVFSQNGFYNHTLALGFTCAINAFERK